MNMMRRIVIFIALIVLLIALYRFQQHINTDNDKNNKPKEKTTLALPKNVDIDNITQYSSFDSNEDSIDLFSETLFDTYDTNSLLSDTVDDEDNSHFY